MSDKGLAIRSIDDVERLARIAVASGYTSCRKAEEAAMLIITGHELGLSPAQSLRGIYVVSGKPVLSADLMVAVVRKSGLCESWRVVESTAERCTITTRRRGETVDATRTWTMADAKRAGITNKGTWAAYPAAMLRHRCASDLARQEYSDVIMGLYDPEELDADHLVATPQPASMTPDSFAALGVEQPRRVLDAPAEPVDVVGDLRAQASRAESLSALAGLWIAAKADVAALDDRDAQERVWSAFKARARELGATVKALQAEIARQSTPPPPPDGTDGGPSGPRNAANDTATGDGTASDAAPADGASASIVDQIATAWAMSVPGITEHVGAITSARHLEASGRAHLRAISPGLRTHAIHAYADRLIAMSRREEHDDDGHPVVSEMPRDAAVAQVERWLREGPRVQVARTTRRAA